MHILCLPQERMYGVTLSLQRPEQVSFHSRYKTDQNMGSTKVQLGKLISFIKVTYRCMGKELLTGVKMIQRQLHHQSPPSRDESRKPGAHYTVCSSSTGLRLFQGSCLSQDEQLVSISNSRLILIIFKFFGCNLEEV